MPVFLLFLILLPTSSYSSQLLEKKISEARNAQTEYLDLMTELYGHTITSMITNALCYGIKTTFSPKEAVSVLEAKENPFKDQIQVILKEKLFLPEVLKKIKKITQGRISSIAQTKEIYYAKLHHLPPHLQNEIEDETQRELFTLHHQHVDKDLKKALRATRSQK